MDLLGIIAGAVQPQIVIFRKTAAPAGLPAHSGVVAQLRHSVRGNGLGTDGKADLLGTGGPEGKQAHNIKNVQSPQGNFPCAAVIGRQGRAGAQPFFLPCNAVAHFGADAPIGPGTFAGDTHIKIGTTGNVVMPLNSSTDAHCR